MVDQDRDLLAGVRRGHRPSVDRFVRRATPVIQREVARWLLRRAPEGSWREVVAELTQQVFADLFDRGGRLLWRWDPDRASLDTYVRRVAQWRTATHLRKRSRQPWNEVATEDVILARIVDRRTDATIEDRVVTRQLVHRALAAVRARGSAMAGQLLDLLFVRGRDVAEVVDATGLKPAAVYQWRSRLRRELRAELGEEGS